MSESGRYSKPQYNEVRYAQGSLAAVEGKYHVKIGGVGFVLARDVPSGRHQYSRDQAPTFVSKFGSGDPAYRDSTFFGHWAQINWRNGTKQEAWDDEGKFFTSKNVNITKESKFKLSNLLSSLSLVAGSSVDVLCYAIDFSDSRKVFAGCSNGHVWRHDGTSWSDMGDITGNAQKVNCLLFSKIGLNGARTTGAGQIYAGVGTPGSGSGRIFRYDGTWALASTFASTDSVLSLIEFAGTGVNEVYASLGGTGVIQKSSAVNLASGFTVSKDIDYAGYLWDLCIYNNRLYACGGSPENTPSANYLGTLWAFDGFTWAEVQPFEGTVLRCMTVYDNLLFLGSIHGQLYVYNRANIDLLFESPDGCGIFDMIVFADKLHFTVNFRTATNGEEAVYVFDRAGISRAYYDASVLPYALIVNGDDLWIGGRTNGNAYKVDPTQYVAQGEIQSSYFDANLPSIDKIWFDITAEMESLPASTEIECYYKFDEADASWTFIDETTTAGTKIVLFGFPEGTASRKLSYRIIIKTTNSLNTPTIKKIVIRYINQPDFKYLWKMKLACPDNIEWLDKSEPVSPITATTVEGDSVLSLTDTSGFPDPDGERMYAAIEDISTGDIDEFSYTGKSGNDLIGCSSVGTHASVANQIVAIRGRHFHSKLLELKQEKAVLEFVDIDLIVYRVLLSDYSEDSWIVQPTSDLENEVALSILQA